VGADIRSCVDFLVCFKLFVALSLANRVLLPETLINDFDYLNVVANFSKNLLSSFRRSANKQ
jgi:hypothetical protein